LTPGERVKQDIAFQFAPQTRSEPAIANSSVAATGG